MGWRREVGSRERKERRKKEEKGKKKYAFEETQCFRLQLSILAVGVNTLFVKL